MFKDPRKFYNNVNQLYDVASVPSGFDYWFNKILNLVSNMIIYENTPDTLPSRELEYQAILTNHASVFEVKNNLYTTYTTLYNFDAYYNPTNFNYAQPVLGSGTRTIGKDGEVIYFSSLKNNYMGIQSDGGLQTFISRYARLLADIDSTIDIYIINNRATEFPVASDSKTIESIRRFFNRLKVGTTDIISDDSIIENFRTIQRTRMGSQDSLNDLLNAKKLILSNLYSDLGIKTTSNKRAQMQLEEVESDEQLLLINQDDILTSHQIGVDKVNKLFGTNIKVKLNPKYDRKNFTDTINERRDIEHGNI